MDGDARHAVAKSKIGHERGCLPGEPCDLRSGDQPRVAGDLDQDLFQAHREPEASALLALTGHDGLALIPIVDIGAPGVAAQRHHRRQAHDRGRGS
jgi:hypothetical protein